MTFRKILFILSGAAVLSHFGLNVSSANNGPPLDRSQLVGSYYRGDGTGTNQYLKLSQDGNFSFEWHGCLGEYDKNEGLYKIKKDVLILSPIHPNMQKGIKKIQTHFLPLHWGARLYLIPENEMFDFVNQINEGLEPRNSAHGLFYLREGDEKKVAEGDPMLPMQWQDYLLKKPVEGKVVKVESDRVAIVNIGKKSRLKVGMSLTARNPDARFTQFTQLKVISVEDETSKAEKQYKDDKIQEGDAVSTQLIHQSADSVTK